MSEENVEMIRRAYEAYMSEGTSTRKWQTAVLVSAAEAPFSVQRSGTLMTFHAKQP
jgi:hypothetical protein